MLAKRKSKRDAAKGKPEDARSGDAGGRAARTTCETPESTNGSAASVWSDGLSENERFRYDAIVALSQSTGKAVDSARECVLRFTGPDRGRYRSVQTLLLACKKALSERENVWPLDVEAAGRGERARGELQPDPLAKIAREIAAYVLPPPGESPKTKDELMAWVANTWPDERAKAFATRLKQRAEREGNAAEGALPQVRIPRSRVEWAPQLRERVTAVLQCGGDERRLAAAGVTVVEEALHAAPEISDLRTLLPRDGTPEECAKLDQRRMSAAKSARRCLGDPEALIQAVLIAYGYPIRRARGLFEAESKKIKR